MLLAAMMEIDIAMSTGAVHCWNELSNAPHANAKRPGCCALQLLNKSMLRVTLYNPSFVLLQCLLLALYLHAALFFGTLLHYLANVQHSLK